MLRPTGAAIPVIAACMVAMVSADSGSVTLRYGLKPETPYRQTFDMSFVLKMDAEGVDPETGVPAKQNLKNLEQTRAVTVSVMTGGEEEAGTSVEWVLSDVTGAIMNDGKALPEPGLDKLKGLKLGNGRMLLDRRAVEMDVTAGELIGLIPGLKERLIQVMPVLPEKPLSHGDTFEVPGSMEVPGPPGQGQYRVESNMIYSLESLTETEAVFAVTQDISMSRGDGAEPEMRLSGRSSGTATFDRKEGFFGSVEMETSVEMVLRRMAPRASKDGGVTTIPIRIVSTVQGPIHYSMERVTRADQAQSR